MNCYTHEQDAIRSKAISLPPTIDTDTISLPQNIDTDATTITLYCWLFYLDRNLSNCNRSTSGDTKTAENCTPYFPFCCVRQASATMWRSLYHSELRLSSMYMNKAAVFLHDEYKRNLEMSVELLHTIC